MPSNNHNDNYFALLASPSPKIPDVKQDFASMCKEANELWRKIKNLHHSMDGIVEMDEIEMDAIIELDKAAKKFHTLNKRIKDAWTVDNAEVAAKIAEAKPRNARYRELKEAFARFGAD